MTLQSRIQYESVSGEDSSKNLNVIFDDISGHIAIDYSSYYERMATSLETMAANSTAMLQKITTIAEKQTAMETYQKKLKELGEGEGIHIISPYELVSFLTTYRLLIEEGKILSWRDKPPSAKDIEKSLSDLRVYVEKMRANLPKEF